MERTTSFLPNQSLLKAATERLAGNDRIYWLLGASCTGKTTLCKCLSASKEITLCDMDTRIFGDYLGRYTESRHPASCAWLKRVDGLQWVLSLSWEEFNCLNEASNVEALDLFSQEIEASTETRPLLVDGGLSHPYLLKQMLPLANVVCLQRDEDARAGTWELDETKLQMKSMIVTLPNGQHLWEKFLHFDRMIVKTMEDQCAKAGIRIVRTSEGRPVTEVAESLLYGWGLCG